MQVRLLSVCSLFFGILLSLNNAESSPLVDILNAV
jgi:hypothetical protein